MAISFDCFADHRRDLAVGIAEHAFDHLGDIGEQADAAVASGDNIIYVTGLGGCGYFGLPPREEFAKQKNAAAAYIRHAKHEGIRLAIGYVCATSIVKLKQFDRNWPEELRSQFRSTPSDWRQADRTGKPLRSWYGGDYEPACMNNPDWRTYEKFIIRQQLEAGCDGIFFDNPTVHPKGCFCKYCMAAFGQFLRSENEGMPERGTSYKKAGAREKEGEPENLEAMRAYAAGHPAEFMKFRCTIGREFLRAMRDYARTVKKDALITANNSFNSANVLYAQCRTYGYNIHQMSKTEDFVVVEDMSSQPRTLPGGKTIEYGPSYKQLTAISHGKPVVAVTVADADYHTAPDLVRLAMAEAGANDASYLSWPTWPEAERNRMAETIRPQAEFMRKNSELFSNARPRRDVIMFLPFRKWVQTADCLASRVAAAMMRTNIQYEVVCEDQMGSPASLENAKVLVADVKDLNAKEKAVADRFVSRGGKIVSPGSADEAFVKHVREAIGESSLNLQAPATVRAVVRDQRKRTLVHLLNLNIQKLSSFQDKVLPAENLRVELVVPFHRVNRVRWLSADEGGNSALEFQTRKNGNGMIVETTVPKLEIAGILVVE